MSCLNSHISAVNSGPPMASRLGGSVGSTTVAPRLRSLAIACSSPTRPLTPLGQTTEPSVSVPIATAARSAASPAPDPELEPHGLWSSAYGLFVCPPTPLQPLSDWVERKFAHSERFALPTITAPPVWRRS